MYIQDRKQFTDPFNKGYEIRIATNTFSAYVFSFFANVWHYKMLRVVLCVSVPLGLAREGNDRKSRCSKTEC